MNQPRYHWRRLVADTFYICDRGEGDSWEPDEASRRIAECNSSHVAELIVEALNEREQRRAANLGRVPIEDRNSSS